MRTHSVESNGTRLNVVESGNPAGPPLLFIHGFSQCWLTWRNQLESDLARDFRLIAMDIRGHGDSDKPLDAYGDGKLWADDVNAVLKALELRDAVLVVWSYGGFITSDYLRFYGEHDIAGINLVGAPTKISQESAPAILGGEFLALLPGFFSQDVAESTHALQKFVRLCSYQPLGPAAFYMALGYNAAVPPYVRQGLLNRTIESDDILPSLKCPVLISHGEQDRVVLPEVAKQNAVAIMGARLSLYPESGHALFSDNPERFNRELRSFVMELAETPVG